MNKCFSNKYIFGLLWIFLLFGDQVVIAQNKNRKLLTESTRTQLKLYKKQTEFSIDSFRRAQKRKEDSLRKKNNPDTIPFRKSYRFGFDLSKPISSVLIKTQTNLEFSIDYHRKLRFFYAGEFGFESVSYKVPGHYNYNSFGEYLKVGFDYGIFKITRRNDNNFIYTGIRLAGGRVAFNANSITINDPYFGSTSTGNINGNAIGFWLEFVFGTKVEIIPKLFIGWSARLDSRLNNLTNKEYYPVRVPGYGNSSSAQTLNYTYSIFYSF